MAQVVGTPARFHFHHNRQQGSCHYNIRRFFLLHSLVKGIYALVRVEGLFDMRACSNIKIVVFLSCKLGFCGDLNSLEWLSFVSCYRLGWGSQCCLLFLNTPPKFVIERAMWWSQKIYPVCSVRSPTFVNNYCRVESWDVTCGFCAVSRGLGVAVLLPIGRLGLNEINWMNECNNL